MQSMPGTLVSTAIDLLVYDVIDVHDFKELEMILDELEVTLTDCWVIKNRLEAFELDALSKTDPNNMAASFAKTCELVVQYYQRF